MANPDRAQATYNYGRVAAAEQSKNESFSEQVLWKLLLLTAMAYLMWSDKISIVLGSSGAGDDIEQAGGEKVRAAMFDYSILPRKKIRKKPELRVELPADALNNVTFAIDPGFARRHRVQRSAVGERMDKCADYVARFAPVAMAEMKKFGIPASITLAQGLLESDAGESKLARSTNNHFGIKCFSKRCKRGHCANFTDDSHKDFFVKYSSAWGSFRAHSQFLKKSDRYRHLFEFGSSDYRGWARGLAKAGYATDEKYGDKLIAVIQTLGLDKYDMNEQN